MSSGKLPNETDLGGGRDDDGGGIERIVDPDNYTLRRRLRQLHDAKERVVERKNAAVLEWQMTRDFTERRRDLLVAEVVVDYVQELASVLEKQSKTADDEDGESPDEDEFLNQSVSVSDRRDITLEEFARTRGRFDGAPLDYRVSMEAWAVCNRYFEDVAGAEFEQGSVAPEHNPVDPAGRFND